MKQFRGTVKTVTTGGLMQNPVTMGFNTVPIMQMTETVEVVLARVMIPENLEQMESTRVPLLTTEQINALVNLQLDGRPLLTLEDRSTLYQVVGMIVKAGFDTVYQHLQGVTHRRQIVWNGPTLRRAQEKFEIDVEIMRNKTEVVAGATRCGRCGSEEVITAQRQTRSADEPMTNFHRCHTCGNRWKS